MTDKMAMETDKSTGPGLSRQGSGRDRRRYFLMTVFTIMILASGFGISAYIKKTAPKAKKHSPAKTVPLVRVTTMHPDAQTVLLPALGTVIPAREIVLRARVSGQVLAIHPEFDPGGVLEKGEELLKIDQDDYKLALAQKMSAVADAEYALKLEQGHQDVAKREWQLLNGGTPADTRDAELALRKPHLVKAEADLEAAQAELSQAELNLSRTSIRAPFNAIVLAKNVDVGSQVSPQDQLAELVGTDEYWIQASMPVDRLGWISIPRNPEETGSKVRVIYRNGYVRQGAVIKLLGDLEEEGRMARLLIEVKDPLGMEKKEENPPPLLLGEYVRMEIEGIQLQNVYKIPRSALRDDTDIWIVSSDGKMEIRTINILWRDEQTVLLREGLQPGERLIVSELATPVNGMPVQVVE